MFTSILLSDVSRCIGRPIPCNTPVLATTTAETDATNNVNTPEIDTTATTNLVRITSAMETSTQPDGCPSKQLAVKNASGWLNTIFFYKVSIS